MKRSSPPNFHSKRTTDKPLASSARANALALSYDGSSYPSPTFLASEEDLFTSQTSKPTLKSKSITKRPQSRSAIIDDKKALSNKIGIKDRVEDAFGPKPEFVKIQWGFDKNNKLVFSIKPSTVELPGLQPLVMRLGAPDNVAHPFKRPEPDGRQRPCEVIWTFLLPRAIYEELEQPILSPDEQTLLNFDEQERDTEARVLLLALVAERKLTSRCNTKGCERWPSTVDKVAHLLIQRLPHFVEARLIYFKLLEYAKELNRFTDGGGQKFFPLLVVMRADIIKLKDLLPQGSCWNMSKLAVAFQKLVETLKKPHSTRTKKLLSVDTHDCSVIGRDSRKPDAQEKTTGKAEPTAVTKHKQLALEASRSIRKLLRNRDYHESGNEITDVATMVEGMHTYDEASEYLDLEEIWAECKLCSRGGKQRKSRCQGLWVEDFFQYTSSERKPFGFHLKPQFR